MRDTMSRPMTDTPKRRTRRQFTDEFKTGVVHLVLDEGKTLAAILDLILGSSWAGRSARSTIAISRSRRSRWP
jgi:hypothetical protein